MADIDNEVFDQGEPVKKERKKRAPMSASKKLAFAARMKASREAKKALKEQAKKPKVETKVEPVVEKVKKPKRTIRHVPDELDNHLAIINSLKADIAEMKLHQNSKKDLDEIKALKSELKAIRAQKRKEEKTKDIVVKVKEEPKKEFIKEPIVEKVEEVEEVEEVKEPLIKEPPRYSTYKKSIWANLL